MKKLCIILLAASLILPSCDRGPSVIRTATPPRPSGQKDMLGFTADPIPDVGVGIVGVGMRGSSAVKRLTMVPGCHIAAICDVEPDRTAKMLEFLSGKGIAANEYAGEETSYQKLCEDPSVDLVYICTDWAHHVPVALYAMEHGKHVAIEVPSAESVKDCWDLVNTAERTRRHCTILENCCYDFFELQSLAMAQAGVLGEIIHVEGAYNHNLEPWWDLYWSNWRMDFNQTHRGDLYPTHGFGPVCQALNIHRGDRLTTLVAMDTDPFNGPRLIRKKTGEPCNDFKNGDVTTTMIRTAKGKTILLEHDVMTPRPYSRMYQLVGTDGYIGKYPTRQICLGGGTSADVTFDSPGKELVFTGKDLDSLMARYPNPILTPELQRDAKAAGGHGGMDYIMDYRLMYCLNRGLPLDMDVYDLAEWCCITELSAISLENGSVPVEIPDFTRGAWDKVKGFSYAL